MAWSRPAATSLRRVRKRRYISVGRPRIASSASTVSGTSTIVLKDEKSASRSSVTPLTTKNIGMKMPKPIPCSLSSSPVPATAPSRSSRLTIAPARNAPSTTSRPNSSDM